MQNFLEQNTSFFTIIPPLIAIIAALISKEVVFSLMLGVFAGTAILSKGDIFKIITIAFESMSKKIGENAYILIFLGLMGILVVLVSKAGGSAAYGSWAAKKISSRRGVLTATAGLGCMIFVDDYFNCLTVGNVMRPITDKKKISRVKLAYVLDSTAAPVCILAPISSWGATISTYLQNAGVNDNGMAAFMSIIPYNIYAIFTVIMVLCVCIFDIRFGNMAKFENHAAKYGVMSQAADKKKEYHNEYPQSLKGKVYDLIIPIITMIVVSICMMIYTGGGFSGCENLFDSFGKCDSSLSLVVGSFIAILVSLVLYIPRKIISFKQFTASISEGVQSMVTSFIILILAWTISEICSPEKLNTSYFISQVVQNSKLPIIMLPAIVFVVSALLGMSTGTSWGTMAILIPVCAAICETPNTAPYMNYMLGAVLSGSVFGDHISPISDTTILSSTGAKCNHLDHVSTQLGHAVIVAICCFIGFLLMGILNELLIPVFVSAIILFSTLFILKKMQRRSSNDS